MPDGYIIIGAANPPALNSTVTEFSIPLANRFTHFNVGVDFDSWLNYRAYNGGNPDVMAFLKTQDQTLLFDKQLLESKTGESGSLLFTDITITPRSWEVVEKVLALPSEQFTIEEKERYCTGRLGIVVTTKFFNFIRNKNKYQSWKEILIDGKPFRSQELDQFWVTQMNCMNAITNQQDDKKCRQYVLNFLNATRKLTKESLKTVNMIQLAKNKRLCGNIEIFNPMIDAHDLMQGIANILSI